MNTLQSVVAFLKERVQHELPHADIHKEGLDPRLTEFIIKAEAKRTQQFKTKPPRICAVMMAMYEHESDLYFPMMLRPSDGHVHGGQISFPGGGCEMQDQDLIATAIRETQEELGFTVKRENIIGQLTKIYIPPSNSLVTPILAYLDQKPTYTADPREVAAALDISMGALQNTANHDFKKVILTNGSYIKMPAFLVDGHNIWGGTARIISELLKMLAIQPS